MVAVIGVLVVLKAVKAEMSPIPEKPAPICVSETHP